MDIDALKNALCKGENSSLIITWNDHSTSYVTLEEEIQSRPEWYKVDSFVGGQEALDRCIAANSVWTLQWYPQTPIGFCLLHAETFAELVDAAIDASA